MAFTFSRQACSSGTAVEQIAKAQAYVLERLAVGLTIEGSGFKTRYRYPEG